MSFSDREMLSIWLVPQEPEYSQLQLLIRRVAELTGGPVFEPHVTILADIPLTPSEVVVRSGRQFRSLAPLELVALRVESGTSYFKSLFMEIDPTFALSRVHSVACSLVSPGRVAGEFEPHVSLAYGTPTCAANPKVAKLVDRTIPMRLGFRNVSVVRASRFTPIAEWCSKEIIRLDGE
ncbi:MAG: hypothetical protein OXL68_07945 [Paracoccaceae bacterium]|nr:hypothetical protein [Paracoccaceae bacterium]